MTFSQSLILTGVIASWLIIENSSYTGVAPAQQWLIKVAFPRVEVAERIVHLTLYSTAPQLSTSSTQQGTVAAFTNSTCQYVSHKTVHRRKPSRQSQSDFKWSVRNVQAIVAAVSGVEADNNDRLCLVAISGVHLPPLIDNYGVDQDAR